MENIDQFMQQKFNADHPEARFEFREEYWEQAQLLLALHEREKRRRRFVFLWWMFAGTAVALALWWTLNTGSTADALAADKAATQQPSVPVEMKQSGAQINHSNSSRAENAAKTPPVAPIRKGYGSSNARTAAPALSSPAAQSLSRPKSVKSGSVPPHNSSPNQPGDAGQSTAGVPATLQDVANTLPLPPAPSAENEPHVIASASSGKVLPVLLSVNRFLLSHPVKPLRPTPDAETKKIQPFRDQAGRLHIGFEGAVGYAVEAQRPGFSFGIQARYRLKKPWYLYSGLGFRLLPVAPADAQNATTEQTRYGFGFTRETYRRESRNFLLLEAPLAVQYRRGQAWVEGGLLAHYTLGLQARILKTKERSLEATETNIDQPLVSQDLQTYRKFALSYCLGGGIQLAKGPGIFVRAAMRPKGFRKAAVDADTPGPVFWIDAGVRFRF